MNVEIADRLLKLRKQNGYSQEGLAEKLGISRQAVSKWERAEASPDTDNLIRLAKLYGVSLDELLLCEEEELEPEPGEPVRDKTYERDRTDEKDWFFEEMKRKENDDESGGHSRRGHYHNQYHKKTAMHRFPYAVVIAVVYFFIGVIWGAWHPWWILFLTIPLYYGIADGIALKYDNTPKYDKDGKAKKQKIWMHKFPYPVLVTVVYLILGMCWNLWHPWWILFVTIPIYYALADWIAEK